MCNGVLRTTLALELGLPIIIADLTLERFKSSFQLPVLAVAISTYFPASYLVSIFIGSLVHFIVGTDPKNQASEGILYSAGLVVGD